MYIEFIGFSSSGKTTLTNELCLEFNRQNIDFNILELDYLNCSYNKNWKSKYFSLLIDIKIFFIYLNFSLVNRCAAMLKDTNLSYPRKINYIRNYIKKRYLLKTYLKRIPSSRVIIADEGNLQSFLNLYTHMDINKYDQYEEFISPNILVYLKPNRKVIIDRIFQRKNRPQWSKLSLNQLESAIDSFNKKTDLLIKRYHTSKETKILVFDDNDDKQDILKIIIKNIIY